MPCCIAAAATNTSHTHTRLRPAVNAGVKVCKLREAVEGVLKAQHGYDASSEGLLLAYAQGAVRVWAGWVGGVCLPAPHAAACLLACLPAAPPCFPCTCTPSPFIHRSPRPCGGSRTWRSA
jgi:hypothetical protein